MSTLELRSPRQQPSHDPGPPDRLLGRLPAHWPLTALLIGYPLWWLLGVAWLMPQIAAAAMVAQLARRRAVRMPPAFLIWLVFLLWVVLSAFMLWTDAPGAVAGGAGPGRVAVYTYRLSWYATVTVVLVWACTLREAELPSRWVRSCLAWLFLVTVVGGVAGLLVPSAEFPSLLELLLPESIVSNPFVASLIHPGLADVQDVLGYAGARPRAPFDYSNTWGANLSMLLPFFLVAWLRDGGPLQRWLGAVVLIAAVAPVVLSLNRGLWGSVILMGVVFLAVLVRRGRRSVLVATVAAVLLAGLLIAASPLGTVLAERLATPHSNDRRGQLLEQTAAAAATGSPVLGFGSTREVQGSFASIAGGATPDCSACSVPPLGTQGQIWTVIFSQGLVGAAIFLAWLAVILALCWRAATTTQMLCLVVLVAFVAQLAVYDTLGMPLFTLMLAAGLVCRQRARAPTPRGLLALARAARRQAPLVVALSLVGLAAGAALSPIHAGVQHAARVTVLLEPVPVAIGAVGDLDVGGFGPALASRELQQATIDTEAALLLSDTTLDRTTTAGTAQADDLRGRTSVTAPARTEVLHVQVIAETAADAEFEVLAMVDSYLVTRRDYLQDRREQAIARVQREVSAAADDQAGSDPALADRSAVEEALQRAISQLSVTNVQAGQILRFQQAEPVRRQLEIPVASGLALGALLGIALAAWRERSPAAPSQRLHRVAYPRRNPATRASSARPLRKM